jgi:type I restriction enzyme S subunit
MITGTGFHRKLLPHVLPIPRDWSLSPLIQLCERPPEYGVTAESIEFRPGMPRFVRITDIDDAGNLLPEVVGTDSPDAADLLLKEGDFLFARSGSVGKSYLYKPRDGHCTFGNYLIRFRPDVEKLLPDYLNAFTRCSFYWRWVAAAARTSTQPNINADEYSELPVILPRPEEQQAINAFVASMSAALESAERKLTAARRLKTALMQQLFTKGIPGRHTQFQETKIGSIPVEWDVIVLRQLAFVDSGLTLNPDRDPRKNARQYLTVVNVQRERLDMTEVRFLEMWDSEIPAMLLKEGDILAVEGHANSGEIGRAAIVTQEVEGMTFQNHLFRVRLLEGVTFNRRFLLGWLNSESVRRHWNSTANTSSGLNTINRRGLRRLLIPKPKDDEQEQIAELLETADQNIAACERELTAVQRLKTSLLQNLLTGKVRVKTEGAPV